jgi:hypothetical protein
MMKADQLIATIDQRLKAAGQKIRVGVREGTGSSMIPRPSATAT